jgi:hypothetical protein
MEAASSSMEGFEAMSKQWKNQVVMNVIVSDCE